MFVFSWVILWGTSSFFSDFIVLKSGKKIQVTGSYEVQGPMVLIKDLQGETFQIPTAAVDIKKTEALKALAPVVPAVQTKPKAVVENHERNTLEAGPSTGEAVVSITNETLSNVHATPNNPRSKSQHATPTRYRVGWLVFNVYDQLYLLRYAEEVSQNE